MSTPNELCLAFAFRFARKSGRHFDKAPPEKFPSPSTASRRQPQAFGRAPCAADPEIPYPDHRQAELDEIDELAHKLLPDFCR